MCDCMYTYVITVYIPRQRVVCVCVSPRHRGRLRLRVRCWRVRAASWSKIIVRVLRLIMSLRHVAYVYRYRAADVYVIQALFERCELYT